MTTLALSSPFPFFTDKNGNALDAGFIYIGTAGLDPRTNPITVYQDAANTITWAQPLRTIAGYPAYQGAVSNFYTTVATYSIIVASSKGEVMFRDLNASSSSLAKALASTNVNEGAALVSFTTGQTLRVLDTVQPLRLSIELGAGGGDETTAFNAFLAKMNSTQRPAIVDRDITVSSINQISGFCVVSCEGDATITVSGGANGFRVINTYTTLGSWTAAPTLTQWPVSTGSYNTAFVVDTATYNGLATGDHVYLSDSVNNTFSYFNGVATTNYTNLAEIAMVVAKSGNTIYLDRVIGEWNRYSASGTVTKINSNLCWLDLNINGERTTVRDLIQVQGYVRPKINATVNGNSSRAVMLIGCMGAQVKAFVDNLRDDEPTAFGYGVCAAAASTDCEIWVNAKRVRHAYSDIIIGTSNGLSQPPIFQGGVVRRSVVSGVGISCTAATWDTHTCSDAVCFINIAAWGTHNVVSEQPNGGLNYAMQVRVTNVRIYNLMTNLQRGITYLVDAVRDTVLEVVNFQHFNTLVGSPTSANSLLSFGGFTFSGSGTHKVNIRSSFIHNLFYAGDGWNFVSLYNSEVNMGTSTSGFPAMITASGTNTIAGTTMTVTAPTGFWTAGMEITSGATAGTRVVKQLSGTTGGAGDYQVSISQTVAAPTAMNARFTTSKTEYVNCVIREPASMNISGALTFDGGKIIRTSAVGFNLLDGANLISRAHGIDITGGGSIAYSAYAFSAISSGTVIFEYSNLWVEDARASGTIRPFVYNSSGATMTIKDVSVRAPIYGTATVDLPSIAAQGTTTFDVTVPGVSTGISWALSVCASADIGALAMTPWVSSLNTVRVRVVNPTAAPIDPASVTMTVEAKRAV